MGWIYRECQGLGIHQCEELNHANLIQACSAKNAGNMAFHTGDDPEAVIGRRRRFLECLNLDIPNLTAAQQTHGVHIQVVEESMIGRGSLDYRDAFPDTDALVTKVPGVVLSIYTADCLPLFVYDPVTPAIGIVHAGWRGTIAGIASLTVRKMAAIFGTNPTDCRVAIGPGIGPECFCVAPDLAARFQAICPEAVSRKGNELRIDLNRVNQQFLTAAGVPAERIILSKRCTCCQPENFYSYRAYKAANGLRQDGRMMSLIALPS